MRYVIDGFRLMKQWHATCWIFPEGRAPQSDLVSKPALSAKGRHEEFSGGNYVLPECCRTFVSVSHLLKSLYLQLSGIPFIFFIYDPVLHNY